MDMFEQRAQQLEAQQAPLANRMRPTTLNDFVGQAHLVGDGRVLRKAIDAGRIPSIIFWGPPGSGKTTLANIIAGATDAYFAPVSAVSAGVADLRRVIEQAQERRRSSGQKTILFIDEIHRFNKAQQDAILPHVETGVVTLIGATTENPSFAVTSPLLSRCQVMNLNALIDDELTVILMRAMRDRLKGLGSLNVQMSPEALEHLVTMAKGDARIAINALEMAALSTQPDAQGRRNITLSTVEDAVQHPALSYDKAGEQHYDVISALHKSMRGSDPDASLYWLVRMVQAGEDPLYVARRVVRFATEDIGMADPQALVVAIAAQQAVQFIGMPEANLALAEAVVYMATAPKSNSLYSAYTKIENDIKQGTPDVVPMHLRNAVTPLMQQTGYGKGYKYAHDYPDHFVEQQNMPAGMEDRQYYEPTEQGYEQQVVSRMKKWWRGKKANPKPKSNGDEPEAQAGPDNTGKAGQN